MAWFPNNDQKSGWLERLMYNVLRIGPIPRHVAIIMDGNRRYASKMAIEKIEGHSLGFEKLAQTLRWCRELDISEVTVYAFSIENFKRPKDEVDGLMNLARDKFRRLLSEKKHLDEYGVCVRFLGQLSLLSEDIQRLAAEIMLGTKDNTRSILNVCLAYTARQEMVQAAQELVTGVEQEVIKPSEVTETMFTGAMYSHLSPPVDLIVRTSGEVRLSDFQLWQGGFAVMAFLPILWPEFGFRHFVMAILYYQRHRPHIQKLYDKIRPEASTTPASPEETKFLQWIKEKRMQDLHHILCSS